jgi:transglutaminase-like putative cysteine protease
VRQADAHAWAEVWREGEGWVRIDPTAAVSPLRVEAGIGAAVPAKAVASRMLPHPNYVVQ